MKLRTVLLGCASLTTNYFSQVFGMDSQLKNGYLGPFDCLDLNSLRVIDQRSGNLLYQLFHRAPCVCVLAYEPLHATLSPNRQRTRYLPLESGAGAEELVRGPERYTVIYVPQAKLSSAA